MQRQNFLKVVRNNFIMGAIVIIPIWVTVLLIEALVSVIKKSFSLLPSALQPRSYISISGFEVLIAFLFILIIGFLVNNIIGARLITIAEKLLSKIPIVRTVYHGVKNLTTGIMGDKKIFSQVVLLEFPIKGLKFIGLVTGEDTIHDKTERKKFLKIFIPTTPNPTTGFFCFAEENQVERTELTVDDAFKLIISAGYANLGFKENAPPNA